MNRTGTMTSKCVAFWHLEGLKKLDDDTKYFDCSHNNLKCIVNLPPKIKYLNCSHNRIESINGYYQELETLYCDGNLLDDICYLPHLRVLTCRENLFSSLPLLSSCLVNLFCSSNEIKSIDGLPETLEVLDCSNNLIETINDLPKSLTRFVCKNNTITHISYLPKKLEWIDCSNNPLGTLPRIGNYARTLIIENTNISTIPKSKITTLNCKNCPIVDSRLAKTLTHLVTDTDHMNKIRYLPPKLLLMGCTIREIVRFPLIPDSVIFLRILHADDYDPQQCIYEIEQHEDIDVLRSKTQIHERFVHLYYSLKYKCKFRNWLWDRVRRPKIERECHPDIIRDIIETKGMEYFLEMDN